MLPCLSKQWLGMECPGCGLQRGVALLLEGRLWDSFLMYPGLFPMLLLFGFIAADRIFKWRMGSQITAGLAVLTAGTILINFAIKIIN